MKKTFGWLGTPESARARPARTGPIGRHRMALKRSVDCAAAALVRQPRPKRNARWAAERERVGRNRAVSGVGWRSKDAESSVPDAGIASREAKRLSAEESHLAGESRRLATRRVVRLPFNPDA